MSFQMNGASPLMTSSEPTLDRHPKDLKVIVNESRRDKSFTNKASALASLIAHTQRAMYSRVSNGSMACPDPAQCSLH